jgi:peptide/nickel transport system substrate-binding protein
MIKTTWLAAAVAAATAFASPAMAQKSADTLRVAWRDQITDIDPYYNSLRTGLVVAHHAWDTLIYRDPEGFVMKPALATSWKWVDDTTLEFELRPNATFHNGDPVTSADVVYTIGIATDPSTGLAAPSNYVWIAGAEALSPTKVRIKLKNAFPAALEYISFVLPIYPKAYREKVGRDGYRREPIGAGPYKFTKADNVAQLELERYEGYYEGSGKGRPAIKKLIIKQVQDASTELTQLLGGQVDWIWQFNPDQFDKIAAVPTLTAQRQEAMRILHLGLDAAGRSGEKNPLTNVLVRKAIWYAIDRQAFARQLVQGGARVPDAPCYFTQFGCDQDATTKYEYNPEKAKALLAEAGYPNGFETELVSSLLPSWLGALQNYLGAVGIKVKLSQVQVMAGITRWQKGETPLYLSSWGSYSINDVSAIMPYFFSGTAEDYARDPELIQALKDGGAVVDPAARKIAYAKATKIITEKAYWLPISTYVTTYGLSRQLNFKAYPDEMPRWFLSSWK